MQTNTGLKEATSLGINMFAAGKGDVTNEVQTTDWTC